MRRVAIAAFVIAGCGRVGFDVDARADGPVLATCDERVVVPVPPSGKVTGSLAPGNSLSEGSCAGDATTEDIYSLDVTVAGSSLQVAADASPDKTIALYVRSDCATTTTELACDTKSGVAEGPLITRAAAPGRYFVFVDGQLGATGGSYEATLRVLLPAGTPCDATNDRDRCGPSLGCMNGVCAPESCDSAFVLGGASPFMVIADTRGQPNLHGGTCGDGGDGGSRGNEMIYRLDLASPVADMQVSTDSPDTDFDTLVYVRAGCNGTELACNDDATPDNNSIVNTGPIAAGSYFIFIDGFGPQSGRATVTITLTP